MRVDEIIKSGKILFFDLDGTVANTNYANNKAYSEAYYFVKGSPLYCTTNGRITRETLTTMTNISKEEYNAVIKEKERIYSNYLDLIQPNDSIIKIIQEYSNQLPIYIVTRSQRKRVMEILQFLKLDNCYKDIICCKNDNKYKEAIDTLGIDQKDIIIFEDDNIEIIKCLELGILNNQIIKIMKEFQMEKNDYLKTPIHSWYHSEYHGGISWKKGTIENMICTIKNERYIKANDDPDLLDATSKLYEILRFDIQNLINNYADEFGDCSITICTVPRAKIKYQPQQLLFKDTIKRVISDLSLNDGTDYLIRKIDTRTTHRDKWGYGGNGRLPYIGITKETCDISPQVKGKIILLIDDVYTRSINIDEDAIQALLDNGADKVFFYSVGYTIR